MTYVELVAKVEAQDIIIKQLVSYRENDGKSIEHFKRRITQLEAEQIKIQSLLFVKDRVSELLSQRVTELEQYSRRYSVIVKGIETNRQENLREEVNKLIDECDSTRIKHDDVDKFHRNGKRIGNQQDLIIRFKSHTAKEEFYKKRKSIPRVKSNSIKIQPSLSFERKKLLGEAVDIIKSFQDKPELYLNPPHFVLPDVHGNLMVKMTSETKDGLFVHFSSLQDLNTIIMDNNLAVKSEANDEFEKVMIDVANTVHIS